MSITPVDSSSLIEQTYAYEAETRANDNRSALVTTSETGLKSEDMAEDSKNESAVSSMQAEDKVSISATGRALQKIDKENATLEGDESSTGSHHLDASGSSSGSSSSDESSTITRLRRQLQEAQQELSKAQAELRQAQSEKNQESPGTSGNKAMQEAAGAYASEAARGQSPDMQKGEGEADAKVSAAMSKVSAATATVQGISSELQAALQEEASSAM